MNAPIGFTRATLSRPLLGALLLGALLALGAAPPPPPAAPPRALMAHVERFSDGDTLVAATPDGSRLRIRLLGIDAPEIPHGRLPGQPLGGEARDFLARLLEGKLVRIEAFRPDRYRRVLAVIWNGSLNVNVHMVAMGYAEVYRGAACLAYCRALEAAEAGARGQRLGIWGQGPVYESPRAFRRRLHAPGEG